MQNKQLLPICFMTVLFFTACNDSKTENTANEASTSTAQQTKESTADEKAKRATINLTLTGGEMAGTYSAICSDACCSWGIAGEKVFGNQYSETGKAANELSSVQLIVDDVQQGSKSTNNFTLTVSFGELFGANSKSFNINTSDGKSEGSGTLDLNYNGDKAIVTIKGTSKEGPSLDLRMECNKVITASNFGQ